MPFFALLLAVALEPGRTEIVIPQDAVPVVRFAAAEMKQLLEPVLGGEIPVVRRPTDGRKGIYLGANDWATGAGVTVDGLARDGYRVGANARGVFIVGKDDPKTDPEQAMRGLVWAQHYERGTLHGVYGFLEKHAGVRLYFPGELGTITPRADRVEVPDGVTAVEPYWTVRRYSECRGLWYEGVDRGVDATLRARWLHWYRTRMETVHVPFCHGMNNMRFLDRFGESHPEYFILQKDGTRRTSKKIEYPGHLCNSSAVWDEAYADAKAFLDGKPPTSRGLPSGGCGTRGWPQGFQGNYIDVMQQDEMQKCLCEPCQAKYDEGRNWADTLIWSKTADFARRLTADGYEARVTQMAYPPYRDVPNVALPDNVDVMMSDFGPWSVAVPESFAANKARFGAWMEKQNKRVSAWTYALKFRGSDIPGVPCFTPHAWGRYYGEMAPYLQGVFAESNGDRVMYRIFSLYLMGRQAWDRDFDAEQAISEFHRLMFGPAAAEMRELLDALEDKWLHGVLSAIDMNNGGPCGKVTTEEHWRTVVYSPAVMKRFRELVRTAKEKTAPGSLERRRVEMMAEELLGPLESAAASWESRAAGRYPEYSLVSGGKMVLRPVTLGHVAVGPNAPLSYAQARVSADALEIAVRCDEPLMNKRKAKVRPKNDARHFYDDGIEIMLLLRDGLVHVAVNSEGSYLAQQNWKAWEDKMTVRVEKESDRWTAKVKIPLSSLPPLGRSFKADIVRYRRISLSYYTEPEAYRWSSLADKPHDYANFGRWAVGKLTPKVELGLPRGKVKPVNGVGQGPLRGYDDYSLFGYLKAAGVPYCRLHDVGGAFGKNLFVDIPNVFRDFDADETRPENYDFSFTDRYMQALENAGVEPYFRLGVTIENAHAIKAYRIYPPKDFDKWARICEHVVRHYTEGWADGFRMKVSHWEIWNEPENKHTIEENAMWKGTFDEYIRLYETAAKHLKTKFPNLMVGGYGGSGLYGISSAWARPSDPRIVYLHKSFTEFLTACRDRNIPLDFFSLHCYDTPEHAEKQIAFCRKTLDEYGFAKAEISLNEWLSNPSAKNVGTAKQASEIAAMLTVLQNSAADDAEIYDARASGGTYSPLFSPETSEPRKAFYVYLAFNELRKLGTALPVVSGLNGYCYATAATDERGSVAVLVSNMNDCVLPFDFALEDHDLVSLRVIDEKRTYDQTVPTGVLTPESVWLAQYMRH